jgi:hypothetical protein
MDLMENTANMSVENGSCFVETFSLKAGLRKFGERGKKASSNEM